MDPTRPSLELVPMDPAAGEPPEPAAPESIEIPPVERRVPVPAADAAKADPYAAQASREFADGHIDQPLWDRALAQANGDTTAAAAIYVRARATAIRLLDRDRKADQRLRAARAPDAATQQSEAVAHLTAAARRRASRDDFLTYYRVPLIAAAVLLLLVAGGWFALSDRSDDAEAAATAAPRAKTPVAAPAKPVVAEAKAPLAPDFRSKIQELRDAGNWNVFTLYAVEWTRKEPQNPAAWDELRSGYVRLRQYEDALAAATKATQLSPDDARLWRHVGEVNLDLDDPPAALAGFEQAVARDAKDIESLKHIGLLQARLGKPQEAKAAFDRALALAPGDAVAVCLRTAVSQMTPATTAYAAAQQIKAIDGKCRGRAEPVASAAR